MASIGIDCRFAGTGTGLARYTVEIAKGLARQPGIWTLFVRNRHESWIAEVHESVHIVEADFAHYSLAEQTKFPRTIAASAVDILFVPHFNAPLYCPVPFVITVHDLILHRYTNRASLFKRLLYKRVFSAAIKKSHSIIAVSRYVAEELREFYPVAATKMYVVTEGVGEVFQRADEQRVRAVTHTLGMDRPYFLYVGNAKEHKNVQTLIDAFHASGVTDADLLLVTGGKEADRLDLGANVRRVRAPDDSVLASLYSGARAFVTASLYEGYCLPIAEALACGCPVIASNRGAIPETLGTHGLCIEPTVSAFAAAFRKPPAPSAPMIIGNWSEAGRNTLDVLQKAIE